MTGAGTPPVGGLGEEAMKLLQAVQEWARETTGDAEQPTLAGLLSGLNENIGTGGKECQYCPLCRLLGAMRATSPEVKHHFGVAASSLLQAAAGALSAPRADSRSDSVPVEHIDLDGDKWEDED